MIEGERVLVTGSTGFLGANLCYALAFRGVDLHGLHRRGSFHPILEELAYTPVRGDILDYHQLRKSLRGMDKVFHLAGVIAYTRGARRILQRVHVDGTRNVIRAAQAAGVKKVVVASSIAALGIPPRGIIGDEFLPFDRRWKRIGYMATKRDAEALALSASRPGFEVTSVLPGTIIGPGDIHFTSTGTLIETVRGWSGPRIAPPGGTSVVSMRDAVTGHILAMEKGVPGRRYILVRERVSYARLLSILERYVDPAQSPFAPRKIRIRRSGFRPSRLGMVSHPLLHLGATLAEGLFATQKFTPESIDIGWHDRGFSGVRTRRELGWCPRLTVAQAAREAVAFHKDWVTNVQGESWT